MAKQSGRGDAARQAGLVYYPQGLSNCSVSISMVVDTRVAGFSIPKIGHIFCLWRQSQEGYGEMDATRRFHTSNKSRIGLS